MSTHKNDYDDTTLSGDIVLDADEPTEDADLDDDWESGYADEDARFDEDADPETDLEATDGEWDLEARYALKRVGGLRTELEDITEVEYRQLRLERVVLVGVWTEGTTDDAENSLSELAALA
jgi:GTP-binding protein HflX